MRDHSDPLPGGRPSADGSGAAGPPAEMRLLALRDELAALLASAQHDADVLARTITRDPAAVAGRPSGPMLAVGGPRHRARRLVMGGRFACRVLLHSRPLLRPVRHGLRLATDGRARAVWRRHFDGPYYARENPDVAAAGVPAGIHYLLVGYLEDRDPSPGFSGDAYRRANPDTTDWNPLAHYAVHGAAEGRPVFPRTIPPRWPAP